MVISKFKFMCESGRDPFKHMYSHTTCQYEHLPYDENHKKFINLQASCLKAQFHELVHFKGVHPCEQYGTNDFKAIWIEDEKGDIAARTIMRINSETSEAANSPIFAASIETGELLIANMTKYCKDTGFEFFEYHVNTKKSVWYDARLHRLPQTEDHYKFPVIIGTYNDMGLSMVYDPIDPANYLKLVNQKEIDAGVPKLEHHLVKGMIKYKPHEDPAIVPIIPRF